MTDHELKKIEDMFQHHSEKFQHKLDIVAENQLTLSRKVEQFKEEIKEEIKEEFQHQLGIQSENFQHKLDVIAEGHQMLSDKIDRVEVRLDQRMDGLERKICEVDANLSKKLDAVAADLKEHRADTEAHKKIYKVKEE